MHHMKTGMRGRAGLLAAITALVATVGLLPLFGSTAYAAGIGLNKVVQVSQFIIPGGPISATAGAVPASGVLPAKLTLTDTVAGLFPVSGELVLNNTEVIVYSTAGGTGGCSAPPLTATQVCVTARAKVGDEKTYPSSGVQVKLATQLTAEFTGGVTIAHSLLNTAISASEGYQEKDYCFSNVDDDGDGKVNDGCPAVGAAETVGAQCDNATDNDSDGWVNDGCPAVGDVESPVQCTNAADDDGDGRTNDGCPAVDGPDAGTAALAELGCDDAADDNEEGGPDRVNDGCPVQINSTSAPFGPTNPLLNPIRINVASTANFLAVGDIGYITISHQDTDAGGAATEYFKYDNEATTPPCGTLAANQLCLVERARNPNNFPSIHPANGYAQGGGTPGVSKVDLHVQMPVKSNAGFFPAGGVAIYDIGAGNVIQNLELVAYNNAVGSKIKTVLSTQFHVTARGNGAQTFDNTDIITHAANSIVTAPNVLLVCRNRNDSPMAGGNPPDATNSVGIGAVCYTRGNLTDDTGAGSDGKLTPPKTLNQCNNVEDDDGDGKVNDGCPIVGPIGKTAVGETGAQCADAVDQNSFDIAGAAADQEDDDGDVTHNEVTSDGDGRKVNDGCPADGPAEGGAKAFAPGMVLVGSTLVTLNGIAQPFLSTGGFCHVLYGPVGTGGSCPGTPPNSADTNGTKDGTLILISPCIINFTPGINLKVEITAFPDKFHATRDLGTIKVTLDSITGPTGGADTITTTHDDCDDAAGTSRIEFETYDAPGTLDPRGTIYRPEVGTDCANNEDDDNNGKVNDGCPAQGPETGGQCDGNADDDSDGKVNDGCPAVLVAETGAECNDAVDENVLGDDGASTGEANDKVNDGCPTRAVSESGVQCNNAVDDSEDGALDKTNGINDGCPAVGADVEDDDTDGDGCADWEELGSNQATGGRRDPWNPFDFMDPDGNKTVNVPDILAVASAYGDDTGPNYTTAKDRGTPKYGPYDHNRPEGDGVVNVFDDILVEAGQFGNTCGPSNT